MITFNEFLRSCLNLELMEGLMSSLDLDAQKILLNSDNMGVGDGSPSKKKNSSTMKKNSKKNLMFSPSKLSMLSRDDFSAQFS